MAHRGRHVYYDPYGSGNAVTTSGYPAASRRTSKGLGFFLILFGFVFFAVGVFLAWLMNSDVEGVVKENAAIGTGAGILFAVIGLVIMIAGVRQIMRYQRIVREGRRYRGKIWQHEPDLSFYVNNQPGLLLVVHYFGEDGTPKEETVSTGSVSVGKFPIGSTVEIAVLDGEAIFIPKSVSNDPIPCQEELMQPIGLTAAGAPGGFGQGPAGGGAMAVACPGCGEAVMMLPGSSIQCPACGRAFTLTADRMIVS